MPDHAHQELLTLRDLLRFAVSRFNQAGLFFGHGTDNAWDEAAYLLLHTLHLPLDRLEPFLDARLTGAERSAVLNVIERRVRDRVPAATSRTKHGLASIVFMSMNALSCLAPSLPNCWRSNSFRGWKTLTR